MSENLKQKAAEKALEFVRPGMKLGLGTGSTATLFVSLLSERVKQGLDVRCVATSGATERHARSCGMEIESLDDLITLDLTVDGTDEIDPAFRLIKGGGGALLREKIVACASQRMLVIADHTKKVDMLGAFALPIELAAFGHRSTLERVKAALSGIGSDTPLSLRKTPDGEIFRTDNGNVIADAALARIPDPEGLEAILNAVPGVVECGLFLGIATDALIATADGVEKFTLETQQSPAANRS